MPNPTVTVDVNGPKVIEFDSRRLEKIEVATDRSVLDIVAVDLANISGATDVPGALMAMRSLKVGNVRAFLQGCLDMTEDQLDKHVPLNQRLPLFVKLAQAFAEAVTIFVGGRTDAHPPEGSGAPAPGPESASA